MSNQTKVLQILKIGWISYRLTGRVRWPPSFTDAVWMLLLSFRDESTHILNSEDITNNRLRKKYTVLVSYTLERTKGAALVHCLKKDHKLRQLYNVYPELLNCYSCNYSMTSSPLWKSPFTQNVKKSEHTAPLQPKTKKKNPHHHKKKTKTHTQPSTQQSKRFGSFESHFCETGHEQPHY